MAHIKKKKKLTKKKKMKPAVSWEKDTERMVK